MSRISPSPSSLDLVLFSLVNDDPDMLNDVVFGVSNLENIFKYDYRINDSKKIPKALRNGANIFHGAAYFGSFECLRYLMTQYPYWDYKMTDKKGRTISHFAAYSGNIMVFLLLNEVGVNFNEVKSKKNKLPIHIAIKYDKLNLVKYLILNCQYCGINFLMELLNESKIFSNNIMNFLVEFGANDFSKITDSKGVSLFTKAIRSNNKELLMNLLNNFIEQRPDSTLLYPIHQAAKENNSEFIELLLEYGAGINSLSKRNETPLFIACRQGALNSVLTLIELGADTTIKNLKGLSLIDIAKRNKHNDVVDILYQMEVSDDDFDDSYASYSSSDNYFSNRYSFYQTELF